MSTPTRKAWNILESAELVCSADQIDQAIISVSEKISAQYAERFPIIVTVMNGAIFFCGKMLPLLRFPLTLDYVHASRYGVATSGSEVKWHVEPSEGVRDRDVIVVDDILDAGVTLAAIRDKVLARGARSCAIAVLADKRIGRNRPVEPDFVGVELPDRFVFGCGLDVGGYWRNLPAIYAVKGM
jgi:hypoxanthine phosphoribosyltransferase